MELLDETQPPLRQPPSLNRSLKTTALVSVAVISSRFLPILLPARGVYEGRSEQSQDECCTAFIPRIVLFAQTMYLEHQILSEK